MYEYVVVVSVGQLRQGQRFLSETESPLAKAGYLKEVKRDAEMDDRDSDLVGTDLDGGPRTRVSRRRKKESAEVSDVESGAVPGDEPQDGSE
jgi:hypothetical protein